MGEIRSTKTNETLTKIELAERGLQDAVIALFLLFTGLVALNVIGLMLHPGGLPGYDITQSNFYKVNENMVKYAIPWAATLALLIIARELWLMRIYMEGIHIGIELENMLGELKKIEELEERTEKELEKIEKVEEEIEKVEEDIKKELMSKKKKTKKK